MLIFSCNQQPEIQSKYSVLQEKERAILKDDFTRKVCVF